jgi:hypothetical protein
MSPDAPSVGFALDSAVPAELHTAVVRLHEVSEQQTSSSASVASARNGDRFEAGWRS